MTKMYLMQNLGLKLTHTYSQAKRDRLIEEGWVWAATVKGWNTGISYKSKEEE